MFARVDHGDIALLFFELLDSPPERLHSPAQLIELNPLLGAQRLSTSAFNVFEELDHVRDLQER